MKTYITSLGGFSPSITKEMDGSSRMHLLIAALTVLLVATLSGLLFATTFSRLVFKGEHFWALFAGWFAFIWLLDVLVLIGVGSRAILFIRISIALLLGLFNSITLDTMVFDQDIQNFLSEEYRIEVAQMDSTFRVVQVEPIEAQMITIRDRNAALYGKIKESHDRVFAEYDGKATSGVHGPGKHYWNKVGLHKIDSTAFQSEIAGNDGVQQILQARIDTLRNEHRSRVAEVVRPELAGLRDSVNALHRLIWGPKGTATDQLYFALLFLLGFTLEALVLIVKAALRSTLATYHKIVSDKCERSSKRIMASDQQADDLARSDDLLRFQRRSNEMSKEAAQESYRAASESSVDAIEAKMRQTVKEDEVISEAILQAQQSNTAMKKEMDPLLYEVFGQEIYNLQLAVIKAEVEKLGRSRNRQSTNSMKSTA